jgi:hypothetical protein
MIDSGFFRNRVALVVFTAGGVAYGSAVYAAGQSPVTMIVQLESCTLTENIASGLGNSGTQAMGALYVTTVSRFRLDSCTFNGNFANRGLVSA